MRDEEPILIDCEGTQMVGILHRVSQAVNVAVVMVVGGPQYRVGSHRMYVEIARGLADAGIPVLRFDFRGMGDSDGKFNSFQECERDLRSAIDAAIGSLAPRVVLFGLCDGASAIACYAAKDSRVIGASLLNPWVRSQAGEARAKVSHYYPSRLRQREFWIRLVTGRIDIVHGVRSYLASRRIADAAAIMPTPDFVESMRTGLDAFHGELQILLSTSDLSAQEFRDLIRAEVRWLDLLRRKGTIAADLPDADHTLSAAAAMHDALARLLEFVQGTAGRTATRGTVADQQLKHGASHG